LFHEYFTEEEAKTKVGKRVRGRRALALPAGAEGTVTEAIFSNHAASFLNGWYVVVTWDGPAPIVTDKPKFFVWDEPARVYTSTLDADQYKRWVKEL